VVVQLRRWVCLVAVLAVVLLGQLAARDPALGGPAATCLPSGSCVSLVNSPAATPIVMPEVNGVSSTAFSWLITLTGAPPTSAVFRSRLDASLAVRLDTLSVGTGSAGTGFPPPGSVTATGRDFSLDLSSLLTAPTPLFIQVSFLAKVSPRTTASLSSSAEVTFDNAAGQGPAVARSAAVLQHALLPDLALSVSAAELSIPRGRSRNLGFTVVNRGAPVTEALADLLAVQVPAGFRVTAVRSDREPAPYPCDRAGPGRWTCALPHPANLDTGSIVVAADAATAPGTTGRIELTVQPLGGFADPSQANNSAGVAVRAIDVTPAPTPTAPQLAATGPRQSPAAFGVLGLLMLGFGALLLGSAARGRR
jgi:hypothetical protein